MKQNLNKVLLLAKKHSPELLVGTGIVAIIGGTAMAVKAGSKAHIVMDEHEAAMNEVDVALELADEGKLQSDYTLEDVKKDKVLIFVQTGVKFIKLYGPAVTLVAGGIACVLGAHGIMKKRNVAMLAAYNGVEKAFSDYKERVVKELGEDRAYELQHGIETEKIKEKVKDKEGKTKTVTKDQKVLTDSGLSQYARVFDNLNPNWNRDQGLSKFFLQAQQNYANDLLRANGHVFLNDVYKSLGIDPTPEGQLVGWVWNGDGDNYIDFGIFDGEKLQGRSVLGNAGEHAIILDFNVDGMVYDLI